MPPPSHVPAAEVEGRGRSCQRKVREAVEREASGAWRTIGYVQEIRTGKEGPGGRELSVLSPVTSSVYLNRTEGAQEKGRLRIRIQDSSQKYVGGNGIGHERRGRGVTAVGKPREGHLTSKRGLGSRARNTDATTQRWHPGWCRAGRRRAEMAARCSSAEAQQAGVGRGSVQCGSRFKEAEGAPAGDVGWAV